MNLNRTSPGFSVHLAVLLFAILVSSALSYYANAQTPQEIPLESRAIKGPLSLEPEAAPWKDVPPMQVPLAWQNITKPMLLGPSIGSILVRSVHNGTWIAFMLEWSDKAKNADVLQTQSFRDAVAVMFPLGNESQPPFLGMGEVGRPVNIWHWKADWQEDVSNQFQEIGLVHPNLWVNYYPLAEGNQSYPSPPVTNLSKTFVSGLAAGNPMSNPFRTTPVEDLIAEGFGSLTSQPQQDVTGNGVWRDGVWKVVLARPITTADPNDAQFEGWLRKNIAFSVWDGGAMEVDGRKSFSNWHLVAIQAGVEADIAEGFLVPATIWRIAGIAGIYLLSAGILLFLWSRRGAAPQRPRP